MAARSLDLLNDLAKVDLADQVGGLVGKSPPLSELLRIQTLELTVSLLLVLSVPRDCLRLLSPNLQGKSFVPRFLHPSVRIHRLRRANGLAGVQLDEDLLLVSHLPSRRVVVGLVVTRALAR